jgi:hypothetical protein
VILAILALIFRVKSLNTFLLLCIFICGYSFAQGISVKTLHITQTDEIITIDGKLDEPVWQKCELADNFQQQFPFDTSKARSKTEVRVTYDNKAIYISAICYEKPGKKYVVESLKRDFGSKRSDCFNVYIDPYNDKINGFVFGVNPFGAQREGLIEYGGNFDASYLWDNKWLSAVERDSNKWVVEMKIPFKTIRYKSGNDIWRINFMRSNPGDNEISVWNKVPFNFNNLSLAYTGELKWDKAPPKPSFNISIIPYAIGGFNSTVGNGIKWNYNFGGDVKIGVTPSLNLDLTFNPDFSQVDVDQQVTNLTRFSLFFPERRQFFLENAGLFSNFGFTKIRPFFSRRIGLYNGQQVPIIAGARLSGKLSKKIRIGLMNIQTAGNSSFGLEAQNYTVAAVQWQAFGRSNLSMIFVNRQGFKGDKLNPDDYNRVIGMDYDLQSKDSKWIGKFFFHHSISPKNNDNAFAHASFVAYNTRKLSIVWNHEYVGKNYNAETGFVPRQFFYDQKRDTTVKLTYWRIEPSIEYNIYPKSKSLYRVSPGIYHSMYTDSVFRPNDLLVRLFTEFEFYNTSQLNFNYTEYYTCLLFPIDVTGSTLAPLPEGPYHYRDATVNYTSNARKRFTFFAEVTAGSFFTGTKLSYTATLNYRIQPWGNIGLVFTRNEIWLGDQYGEAHLMLISPKVEFTFRKNIFWTTFIQLNTQINNMNIYSRFQWRFAPMSDIFLVYSENINIDPIAEKTRGIQLKFVYWFTP